jgi:hypothetical protein
MEMLIWCVARRQKALQNGTRFIVSVAKIGLGSTQKEIKQLKHGTQDSMPPNAKLSRAALAQNETADG